MFLSTPPADGLVQDIYGDSESEDGFVANFIRLWCWRPQVHLAYTKTRAMLLDQTELSPRETAVLNSATACTLRDSYCSIAWGTRLANLIDSATAGALLRREETPALSKREQALVAWVAAVVAQPSGTTRHDVEKLQAAGFSELEIFDATALVAFRLAFSTVNNALGARPDRQLANEAPLEVLASVNYGRSVAEASVD
jgi:uncharacterized peroxidase-related enzyme